MLRALVLLVCAVLVFAGGCPAQEQLAPAFAKQVQADVALLESSQSLDEWEKTHPGETVQAAGYEPGDQWPESDFSRLSSRCAISVGRETSEATRSALFVVPLPAAASPALIQNCRMQEMWVEMNSPVSRAALIQVLTSSWGEPNGPSQPFRDAIFFASRKDLPIWHRAGMSVWVVNRIGPKLPVAVYARNDIPAVKDWYDVVEGWPAKVAEQSAAALGKIAALDPDLTKAVLARTSCATGSPAAEDPQLTAERLERWLKVSKSLTSSRRAAALLIADYYMSCSARAPQTKELKERYVRMGADFFVLCPRDTEYSHTFRKQAEEIDRVGIAGEWAALASFWQKCDIAYGKVVKVGEGLARKFPEWRPYVHYALALSHDAILSRYYPGGSPEEGLFGSVGAPIQVDPGAIERERAAAIRDFTSFLREKPADPEATFAWQEVWRLRAGLKPTRVTFGCSCE